VYSGIDPAHFGKEYPSQEGLRAVFNVLPEEHIIANIAALAPHKDYYTFVDTISILKEKGVVARYFAIGEDGGELENVRNYARSLGVDADIIFTGFRKNIAALAQDIEVMLVTSKEEGLCTSILDAFAGRIPVVATRAGGISEIVRNEQTGLTAPVKDPARLAVEVMRMLNDADLRRQCLHAALEFVKEFDYKQMAKKIWEHYTAISQNTSQSQS
jgi:glycosyltransferase involved in cell wall biosynthesis